MKVGAGGLQVQTVHDEVTNRQAQESRRTDYQPKPVSDSDNTEALNRHALNKTVEKTPDAAQSFDLPLRLRRKNKGDREKEENQEQDAKDSRDLTGGDTDAQEENGMHTGLRLDKYI